MRTITTNLYQYTELNAIAKNNAIRLLRQRCFEANDECTWEDANETMKVVEESGNVYVDICDNSQGFYVNNHYKKFEENELTDEELFERFRDKYIRDYKEMLWCDHIMLNIVKEYKFDDSRSYSGNIGCMMVEFCKIIYNCTLDYFDDDNVEEWILGQDFEFLSDGRLYQQ